MGERHGLRATQHATTHRAIVVVRRSSALALIIVLRVPVLAGVDAWTPTGVPDVYVLEPDDLPMPTPTPTIDWRCAPDAITLEPSPALSGGSVTVQGVCYFLHSGRHADVYFDTTIVGAVTGDTLGAYQLTFAVPGDALPGWHRIRVVGAQSSYLTVDSHEPPTPTPTPDSMCPPQNITVVPSNGPAGSRVVVSGQCYWLHSGGGGEIDFDDISLGSVHGGQGGDYAGVFQIPEDAAPGAHAIALVQNGTRQLAPFVVSAAVVLYRGDCNTDGTISVDELVRGVAIALGVIGLDTCPSLDVNADGAVTIDELIRAVDRSFLE